MIRMTKDGEVTVPSSEEYARQLESEGWSYVTNQLVQSKPLPEGFPMRAELFDLGITSDIQLGQFLELFAGQFSRIRRALEKIDSYNTGLG